MPSDNLRELIAESAAENLEALEPGNLEPETEPKSPLLNRPFAVIIAWTQLLLLTLFFYLNPVGHMPIVGEQSLRVRLSTEIYQIAYRIEAYRNETGQLPDFLEPEWRAQEVNYILEEGRYELQGQMGDLEIIFREGEDPETLMHNGVVR